MDAWMIILNVINFSFILWCVINYNKILSWHKQKVPENSVWLGDKIIEEINKKTDKVK